MGRQTIWGALALTAGILVGCGGGGGSSPGGDTQAGGGGGGSGGTAPPPATAAGAAEGLWRGTLDNGRTLFGLVFENGSYQFFYTAVGDPDRVAGVIQGQGAMQGTDFADPEARDFRLETLPGEGVEARLSATPGSARLVGHLAHGATSVTFNLAYDDDYAQPPSLAVLAGDYVGDVRIVAGAEPATVTIAANGAISGAGASGCAVQGEARPHADGHAYHFTLSFRADTGPCHHPATEVFTGVAYLETATGRLYAAATNATRDGVVLFVGARQP